MERDVAGGDWRLGRPVRAAQCYREALHLTKHLDLSIREAAAVAKTTETAMKLRVHRAYRKLRDDLAPRHANQETSP